MVTFKYDVSVIIPIYNAEKYLEETINSVLKQTHPLDLIEIILINDGSTDKSEEICLKYKNTNNNIAYFSKTNGGVSSARNVGLKHAKGKYIMFLDSDDYISEETVSSLYLFFEQHYHEVDLVTYRILNLTEKKIYNHVRLKYFSKSEDKIFDLDDEIFPLQTNINIIIKNKLKSPKLFDEKFNQIEDQKFITEILMEKKKLGFCYKPVYYYRKDSLGISTLQANPYYAFETYIGMFEEFIIKYSENSVVNKYIQALILYNFAWKIKQRVFYPEHYEENEYKKSVKRVEEIIKKINSEMIVTSPFIDPFHKSYFLFLNKKNLKLLTDIDGLKLLNTNGETVLEEKQIEIVFTKFRVRGNQIDINAFLKSKIFHYVKPKLYVQNDKKIKEIKLKLSNHSNYKSRIKTNIFYSFDIKIPLDVFDEYNFVVKINKKISPVRFIHLFNSVFFKKTNKNIIIQNRKISLDCTKIKISKPSFVDKSFIKIKSNAKYLCENYKISLYRIINFFYPKKKIVWLYSDRKGVIDNAFYQFKNDFSNKDNIIKYYVVDGDITDFKNKFTVEELKFVVNFKSLKHKMLFLNSSKILTSFSEVSAFCPFGKGLRWYLDIVNFELIYLQHGILHAHLPWLYSKEKSYIDKFVVSSNFEKNNLINNYNYNKQDLILSGMPRLDVIETKKDKKNKILLALSWRSNLIGPLKNNDRELKTEDFLKSKYYKELNNVLKNKQLNELLKKYNIYLDVISHPIFKPYDYLFDFSNKQSHIKNIKEAHPGDYKLLITDYSSIVFDYVYNNCSIMYFVPDYELFRAGVSHNYNKLDLPLEEGFGPLCLDVKSLINEIEKYLKNNYMLDKTYVEKSENFFITKTNHRQKLYEYLKKDN